MFELNEVPDLSSDDAALKRFVTREPISIFSLVKEEKKEKFNQLLEALRKILPEGFKIGAAVGKRDCFFDSVAQGLNELKDKGLITSSEGFSIKSLRESCKQYAQKSSWLALKGEGEKLCERIEFTSEDIESSDSGIKTLKLENAIWGRPKVEGKMICEKYCVKIRIIELRDEDGLHVTEDKVGTGSNIIYIVNYRNHFVPLLSNIEKDIKRSIKVSREEAYGNVVDNISPPLQNIDSRQQSDHSTKSLGNRGSRKRGRSVKDSIVLKELQINLKDINKEIKFTKSVAGKEGTPAFSRFLIFLVEQKRLQVLERKKIQPNNMSSILSGARAHAKDAFEKLYDLWFDEQGNKKQCLKTLEKNNVDLVRMSSILRGAGAKAATAFKDLYDVWFDEQGNKKQCLKTLVKNNVDLVHISSMLSGAGAKGAKAFKDLYDVKNKEIKHCI